MRLIDADALLYEDVDCIDGTTYMVVNAPQIDNAPTAFDLQKLIEQLEDRALEHAINGQQYGEDGYSIHEAKEQGIQQGIEIAIEILKSGVNTARR